LPKPNYSFEKRQRDLAKKRKQDAKRQRKIDRRNASDAERPDAAATPPAGETPEE